MANDRINFYYDPQRQGYDTVLWKTISGTPTVLAGNLILNKAIILHYGDAMRAMVEFRLSIPSSPSSGNYRSFGFAQINIDAKAVFDITDGVFSAKVKSENGNETTEVLPWNPAWTNNDTVFKVSWQGYEAVFFINNIEYAKIRTDNVPKVPMSIFIENDTVDNMTVKSVILSHAQNYI